MALQDLIDKDTAAKTAHGKRAGELACKYLEPTVDLTAHTPAGERTQGDVTSYTFDGSTSYGIVTGLGSDPASSRGHVEFIVGRVTSPQQTIVGGNTNGTSFVQVLINVSGLLRFGLGNNPYVDIATVSIGERHNVKWEFASSHLKVWHNGVLIHDAAHNGNANHTNSDVYIGAYQQSASPTQFFEGTIVSWDYGNANQHKGSQDWLGITWANEVVNRGSDDWKLTQAGAKAVHQHLRGLVGYTVGQTGASMLKLPINLPVLNNGGEILLDVTVTTDQTGITTYPFGASNYAGKSYLLGVSQSGSCAAQVSTTAITGTKTYTVGQKQRVRYTFTLSGNLEVQLDALTPNVNAGVDASLDLPDVPIYVGGRDRNGVLQNAHTAEYRYIKITNNVGTVLWDSTVDGFGVPLGGCTPLYA